MAKTILIRALTLAAAFAFATAGFGASYCPGDGDKPDTTFCPGDGDKPTETST